MREQIINKIAEKLETFSDLTGKVYKYQKGEFESGYPVAVILGTENSKVRESTKTILKTYKVKVQVLQEINQDARGPEDGEDLLIKLADDIDDAFDNDDTLGGVCDDVQVSASFVWENREIFMRVLEMEITCTKLKQLQ